ncbi:hypothetical protein [Clostridium perfringens]|uniref:hypothetical protein n=1 Tax=Clostridium perfringens TaxID=1502 RepID=UPI000BBB5DBE|nr:hypothetical protein [Clostridium perfringens]ELC8372926.1 hypothetical protein [Clostridium perfringens]MBI6062299.1 hypothetical protein [Clostridium perfringens]MCC5432225.1 hypothetical protein [Clostridium perfringens]MCC5436679.1 hypothetical protein [Clostridium perfringens]MCC5444976.1 hypothetical protein [Clostridium perfringens]
MGLFSFFKNKEETKKVSKPQHIVNETNENLSIESKKIIARLMNNPCNEFYSNSMKVKFTLRNMLNTKLERVSHNSDEYARILKNNILFFINTTEDKENLIKIWLNDKHMPPLEQCVLSINSIPDKYKGNNVHRKNSHKLEVYDKFFPINTQIEQLEFDYMFYTIYSEIIHNLLEIILNNREEFLKLKDSNADLVLKDIRGYCYHAASNCLGTLNSRLNI